jgi:hypothetical protein
VKLNKPIAALAAAALAIGGMLISTAPAAAHTPNISASCSGVVLKATVYDLGKQNRYSVTIGDTTLTGTFGGSLNRTFPVPQEAATSTWSAFIEGYNGQYRQEKSGTVGPCGRTTIALPTLEVTPPTCDTAGTLPLLSWPAAENANGFEGDGFRVYLDRPFDGAGTYTATLQKVGPGFDPKYPNGTQITGETTQALTVLPKLDPKSQACFVPLAEPRIQDYVTCDSAKFVLDNLGSNIPVTYTINGVQQEVSAGTALHVSAEPSAEYEISAGDQEWRFATPSDAECADLKPEPIVTSTSTETLDCESDAVWITTSTATQDWVLDGRTWVEAEPVVTTSHTHRDLTEVEKAECEPVVVTPPAEEEPKVIEKPDADKPQAPAPERKALAATGWDGDPFDIAVVILAALVMLALGVGLVVGGRRKPEEKAEDESRGVQL